MSTNARSKPRAHQRADQGPEARRHADFEQALEDYRVEQWFDDTTPEQQTWGSINDARRAQRAVFIETYRRHFRLGKGKSIETGE